MATTLEFMLFAPHGSVEMTANCLLIFQIEGVPQKPIPILRLPPIPLCRGASGTASRRGTAAGAVGDHAEDSRLP